MTGHLEQYECRSCTITLSNDKPEFYFAKPEFDSTESEIIFVDEDIFDGYSDMESNTIILYYFGVFCSLGGQINIRCKKNN